MENFQYTANENGEERDDLKKCEERHNDLCQSFSEFTEQDIDLDRPFINPSTITGFAKDVDNDEDVFEEQKIEEPCLKLIDPISYQPPNVAEVTRSCDVNIKARSKSISVVMYCMNQHSENHQAMRKEVRTKSYKRKRRSVKENTRCSRRTFSLPGVHVI